jgi:hypothetical protein
MPQPALASTSASTSDRRRASSATTSINARLPTRAIILGRSVVALQLINERERRRPYCSKQ